MHVLVIEGKVWLSIYCLLLFKMKSTQSSDAKTDNSSNNDNSEIQDSPCITMTTATTSLNSNFYYYVSNTYFSFALINF